LGSEVSLARCIGPRRAVRQQAIAITIDLVDWARVVSPMNGVLNGALLVAALNDTREPNG
jgi:hypothetical protein